jgi:hypothetical protein
MSGYASYAESLPTDKWDGSECRPCLVTTRSIRRAQCAVVEVVVVEVDGGPTGAGMVVVDSRVVVVDVTGGVDEHAATSRAATQQKARRRSVMFFIGVEDGVFSTGIWIRNRRSPKRRPNSKGRDEEWRS